MTKVMLRVFFAVIFHSTILWSNPSLADTQVEGVQQFATLSECSLTSGQIIAPCQVGYRTYGTLNSAKSNVFLVPTWFTGTSAEHAFLTAKELLNSSQNFIVIVDALANGVSISPSNSKTQADGLFPQITITDMVVSQYRLLTEILGINSVQGVMGLSMGGMQAFEWAVRYPGFAQKTVAAIGSPRLPSFDIALWTTRNRLLAMYRDCQCKEALEVLAGMGIIGRIPAILAQEMPREDVVSTIVSQGAANSMNIGKSWDQQRQAEAMINHNIALDFNNDLKKAAKRIKSQFLIVIATDDRVVTPEPARNFANVIGADIIELDEGCGHGDPWCAEEKFANAVRSFLNKE